MSNFNSVNKVLLVGYVTKGTPEVKKVKDKPTSYCAFNIGTNERFTRNGETVSRAYYHRVVAWGKTAEFCGNWLQKGTLVAIQGKLRPRVWESDAGTRKLVEVQIEEITLLGKRRDREEEVEEEPTGSEQETEKEREPGEDEEDPF